MKGSYVLLIQLPEEKVVTIGSLKDVHLPDGYYAYVGSAMKGIKSRLSHHFKESKRPHWHIDYLLKIASITGVILCESEDRMECTIAQALSQQYDSIPGFGSTDCHCRSHLFSATNEMKIDVMSTLNSLGIQVGLVEELS